VSGTRCNCDESRALRRLVRLFAWRARLLQLVHSCPAAAKPDSVRRKWNRRLHWAETKLKELDR
jgi:hypothetical protein